MACGSQPASRFISRGAWRNSRFKIIVIPSEARDLHFAANCRSFASLRMTIIKDDNDGMDPSSQTAACDCIAAVCSSALFQNYGHFKQGSIRVLAGLPTEFIESRAAE